MRCSNCDGPVTRNDVVHEVKGWTRRRRQGGANQIRDAKPTGRVMCAECGEHYWATGRMRPTVPEGQTTLL